MITARSFAAAAASLFCVVVAASAPIVHGQTVDSFNPNVGLTVLAAALQPDGKIVIGGDFTTLAPNGGPTVTRNHIARLNPDGSVDPDFNPNASGQVRAIAVQTDGKVLAAGGFTSIGGQMRNYVARLDATTGLADSFDPKGNIGTGADAVAVQADGKILIGGSFTSLAPNGGTAVLRQRIARLNESGTLDTSFGLDTGANNLVDVIVVQPNGNILVGGLFTNINGMSRDRVAQLTTTGSPTAFNAGVFSPSLGAVQALAVQADGKVVIVGSFTSVATQMRNRIARLDGTTGAVDSFNPNANNNLFAVAVQPDGKILVGGGMSGANSIGGATRNRIARLDPATGLADSYDPNANTGVVLSIVVQPDGKILVGGSFTNISGQMRNRMARLANASLPAGSKIVSIAYLANAHVLLQCLGVPNQVNLLQASADLSSGSFTAVSPPPAAADGSGAFSYDDAGAVGLTKRFYRLAAP